MKEKSIHPTNKTFHSHKQFGWLLLISLLFIDGPAAAAEEKGGTRKIDCVTKKQSVSGTDHRKNGCINVQKCDYIPSTVAAHYLNCEEYHSYAELSTENGSVIIDPVELRLVGVLNFLKITASECVNFCVLHKKNVSGIIKGDRFRRRPFECHCGSQLSKKTTILRHHDPDMGYAGLYTKQLYSCSHGSCFFNIPRCPNHLFRPSYDWIQNPMQTVRFCPMLNLLNYCTTFGGHQEGPNARLNARALKQSEVYHQNCVQQIDPSQNYLCSLELGWLRSLTKRWHTINFRIRLPLYAFILAGPIVLALNVCLLLVLRRQITRLGRPAYVHQMSLVFSDLVTFVCSFIFLIFDVLMGVFNESMCLTPAWRLLGYLNIPIATGGLISNQLLISAVSAIRFRSFRNPAAYQEMNHGRAAALTNVVCYTLGFIIGLILIPSSNDWQKSYEFRSEVCGGRPISNWTSTSTAADSLPLFIPVSWVRALTSQEANGCRLLQSIRQTIIFAGIYIVICVSLIILTSLLLVEYIRFQRHAVVTVHPESGQEGGGQEEIVEEEIEAIPMSTIQTVVSRIEILQKRDGSHRRRRRKRRKSRRRSVQQRAEEEQAKLEEDPNKEEKQEEQHSDPAWKITGSRPKTKQAWTLESSFVYSDEGSGVSSSDSYSNSEADGSGHLSSGNDDASESNETGFYGGTDRRKTTQSATVCGRGVSVRQPTRTKTQQNNTNLSNDTNTNPPPSTAEQKEDTAAHHEFLMTLVTVLEASLHLIQTVTVSATMICHIHSPGHVVCVSTEMMMYVVVIGQLCMACPIYLLMSPNMRQQALTVLRQMANCQFREDPDEFTIAAEQHGSGSQRY